MPLRTCLSLTVTALSLAMATGCGHLGGMRWSSPVRQGHGRVGIEAGAQKFVGAIDDTVVSPTVAFEYRRGVSKSLDLGARVSLLGGGLDARHVLTRHELVETSVGLGGRGGLGTLGKVATGSTTDYSFHVDPAFRVGINVSRKSQLAFAFTPSLLFNHEEAGATAGGTFVRQGLAFSPELVGAFDLGISDGFHIVPQIGATTYVGLDSYRFTDDSVLLHGALGFYF